jgi:hypothetical protein
MSRTHIALAVSALVTFSAGSAFADYPNPATFDTAEPARGDFIAATPDLKGYVQARWVASGGPHSETRISVDYFGGPYYSMSAQVECGGELYAGDDTYGEPVTLAMQCPEEFSWGSHWAGTIFAYND